MDNKNMPLDDTEKFNPDDEIKSIILSKYVDIVLDHPEKRKSVEHFKSYLGRILYQERQPKE